MFSYSGRVKSPEWRWQRRRADLRHFEIFRHGPNIVYTRTYYLICTFPVSSECLIGISDAFSAFCLRVSVILPTCSLYPQQKRAYSALHLQAWTYIYIQVHARRLLPSAVPWISEDRLFKQDVLGHLCGRWGKSSPWTSHDVVRTEKRLKEGWSLGDLHGNIKGKVTKHYCHSQHKHLLPQNIPGPQKISGETCKNNI